jgi:RNA polymerase sigma factor (sigma-70 family)
MQNKSDAKLLREYAAQHCEPAFAEIVARHSDLVYSAALRQTGSPELAREVAQSVFTDLARKARALADTLSAEASLAGWLFRGTRFAGLKLLRDDRRRHTRERQFMEHFNPASETTPDWERVAPVLDEAMAELPEADHEAVLLRYFKNQDFHAVGLALGVSDDTAQKRVSRAVERLREFFVKRGVTVEASGLVLVISANAVQAAPIGLSAEIATTAALGGKIITAATTATVTKAIAMTILQKTFIAAAIFTTLTIATSTYIAHQRNTERLRIENQTDFPSDSWADSGFATPQAALRTRGWAVVTGNRERFKESLSITDGARNMLEQMIAAAPVSDAEKKIHPEFLNMTAEDATLFPMMGQNKRNAFTNYHILSRQSLSADAKLLEVETQMASGTSRKETLKFQRLGRDWKVVIDEDLLAEEFQKMQRIKSHRAKASR